MGRVRGLDTADVRDGDDELSGRPETRPGALRCVRLRCLWYTRHVSQVTTASKMVSPTRPGCIRSGKRIPYLDAPELEKVPVAAPDRGGSVLSHQRHEVRVRHEIASYRRPLVTSR